MKEISTKTVILPLVVVMVAVIGIAIFAVNSIESVKQECRENTQEISACEEELQASQDELQDVYDLLNTTKEDITKYDSIYEEISSEADQLAKELEKEKQEEPIVYQVPYRTVPNAEAFSKAVRIELMLERVRYAQELVNKDFVADNDLHAALGEAYLTSLEFRNLFIRDGSQQPLGEKATELYRENINNLNDLEQMYRNFHELSKNDVKTRLRQIILLQLNIFEGMQRSYFLR